VGLHAFRLKSAGAAGFKIQKARCSKESGPLCMEKTQLLC